MTTRGDAHQALKIDPLNPELLLAKAEADFLAGAFEKAYRDSVGRPFVLGDMQPDVDGSRSEHFKTRHCFPMIVALSCFSVSIIVVLTRKCITASVKIATWS